MGDEKKFKRFNHSLYRFPDADAWERISDPATGELIPLPPFATREEAAERARRVREGTLHEIEFFNDHGHGPLWDLDVGWTAMPEDYGLSESLTARLRAWHDEWAVAATEAQNTDVYPVKISTDWYLAGMDLVRDLAQEVWRFGDVRPKIGAAGPWG